MTKAEFINAITAKVDGLTKKDAAVILDSVCDVIADALKNGDDIKLPNVGCLSTKDVPEKTGVIRFGDKKGETYVSPAHKKVTFKVAGALKNSLK